MLEPLVVGNQHKTEQDKEKGRSETCLCYKAFGDSANNSQDNQGNPRPPRHIHRNFPAYKGALRAIQAVAIQVKNVVLDVGKSNRKGEPDALQNQRCPADARTLGRHGRKQVVADCKRHHGDDDVDGTGHFEKVEYHIR